eukprot:Rhum_TRINITY_DN15399_c2_g1::Rhum_TRINITY_DN15399_c2_g1_i1::g.154477::m.154477
MGQESLQGVHRIQGTRCRLAPVSRVEPQLQGRCVVHHPLERQPVLPRVVRDDGRQVRLRQRGRVHERARRVHRDGGLPRRAVPLARVAPEHPRRLQHGQPLLRAHLRQGEHELPDRRTHRRDVEDGPAPVLPPAHHALPLHPSSCSRRRRCCDGRCTLCRLRRRCGVAHGSRQRLVALRLLRGRRSLLLLLRRRRLCCRRRRRRRLRSRVFVRRVEGERRRLRRSVNGLAGRTLAKLSVGLLDGQLHEQVPRRRHALLRRPVRHRQPPAPVGPPRGRLDVGLALRRHRQHQRGHPRLPPL